MTDETLAQAAAAGNTAALDALMTRFKPLVKSKAAPYFLSGGDRDDLIQEGMIGLYKAVLDYDPAKNPIFAAFAALCINRQILTAVKTAARHKHAPLNASLALEEADHAPARHTPESLLISRESSNDIANFLREGLSTLEHNVLMLHMEGLSQAQITQTLGKTAKAVDNALQRARNKVRALHTNSFAK